MKILKDKFLFEVKAIKTDVTIVEYLFWWLVRICLVWGLVQAIKADSQGRIIVITANIIGSYAFSILRYISPKKSFLCRTSYRVQTILEFTIFTGCFLLHSTDFYDAFEKNDFILHLISGVTITVVGFYLALALDKEKTANPSTLTVGATGFSFTAIVVWEMMEFVTDAIIPGSTNQNYHLSLNPEEYPIWYNILHHSNNFEGQMPLFDTMVDMSLAAIGTAITSVVIFIIVSKKYKESQKEISEK